MAYKIKLIENMYCMMFKIFSLKNMNLYRLGERCSSVVRALAHGAMGRQIDTSWSGPIELFLIQLVLHDWCNKACGMCYPVCEMVYVYKRTLAVNWKE